MGMRNIPYVKNWIVNWVRWYMPAIPASQKAEIRRFVVQSQLEQIVLEILSRKKPITKKGWWSG
jgi:hypothetical protein